MSIGEFARTTGLSVSTLRFYDGARLLVPIEVDAGTGYRRYGPGQLPTARLLGRLRRIGLPLAAMQAILDAPTDSDLLNAVLDEHLERLVEGLTRARREIQWIRHEGGLAMSAAALTVEPGADEHGADARADVCAEFDGDDLVTAIESVSFALPADPESPVHAVLMEIGGGTLTVAATDRYRLAFCEVPLTGPQPAAARVSLPVARIDDIAVALRKAGPARLRIRGSAVVFETIDGSLDIDGRPEDFPDVLGIAGVIAERQFVMDAETLRARLDLAPLTPGPGSGSESGAPIVLLGSDGEGGLRVLEEGREDEEVLLALNRDFLRDAIPGGVEQLIVDVESAIRPLAIRSAEAPRAHSLLMPVRLP
jgi:DNA-binding transcriptional MerR regulator